MGPSSMNGPIILASYQRGGTIDPDFGPGDVTGSIRGQERYEFGDIPGACGLTAQRDRAFGLSVFF